MKKQSLTRSRQMRIYSKLRKEFLEEIYTCQVERCFNPSTDIHHQIGREGKRLLMQEYWLAVCRECHTRIELNPIWAKEMGYSIERNNKIIK